MNTLEKEALSLTNDIEVLLNKLDGLVDTKEYNEIFNVIIQKYHYEINNIDVRIVGFESLSIKKAKAQYCYNLELLRNELDKKRKKILLKKKSSKF